LVEDYGYIIRKYSPEEADLLMLEGTTPPAEGAAAPVAAPAEGAAPAAPEAVPAEGGMPAATPAAEPVPAEGAAPAAPPAEGAAAPATPPAAPAATPVPPAANETDPEAARQMLEKMAEGEMLDVKGVEEAEAKAAEGQGTAPEAEPAAEPAGTEAAASADARELGRWVWSDGHWVEVKTPAVPEETQTAEATAPAAENPAEVAMAQPAAPETPALSPERLALEAELRRKGVVQGSGQLRRIIRFDVQTLQAGDPTQNVVLRDGDIITIPSPPVGDFYMAGQVSRPGVYSLTGRKITLLQAVAAAGGTTAVAVPWRTEVVRRSSETEEEIIYVDLAKIARGDAPDFYVQPDDLIRVGTDQGAIFNAVLRNAFRATYGLGAVYDMNFADFYPWRATTHPIINQ